MKAMSGSLEADQSRFSEQIFSSRKRFVAYLNELGVVILDILSSTVVRRNSLYSTEWGEEL
jgi:hypothetical protein